MNCMSGSCQAIVFRCIDYRFRRAIGQWLDEQGYGDSFDEVSVAGATKSLVQPFSFGDTAFLMKQLEIAVDLHHVSEVILVHHEDCGAYGGKSAFKSDADELGLHNKEMDAAALRIRRAYPKLKITKLFAMIPDGRVDQIHFQRLSDSGERAA